MDSGLSLEDLDSSFEQLIHFLVFVPTLSQVGFTVCVHCPHKCVQASEVPGAGGASSVGVGTVAEVGSSVAVTVDVVCAKESVGFFWTPASPQLHRKTTDRADKAKAKIFFIKSSPESVCVVYKSTT